MNFGGALPPPFRAANQYEFGHRVVIGLDAADGVFARISLFDTHELAIRLGPVATGFRRYYVWDLDPLARRPQPGVDRIERDLDGIVDHGPRALGEFAATSSEVYERAQRGSDRILGVARARIDQERAERLSRELVRLASVPRDRLPERLERLLRAELQCATNLVVRVASVVEHQIRASGYSWTADYLHALMDAEIAEFTVPVSEGVLGEFSSILLPLVESNEVADDRVHELLFGMTGLVAAKEVLFRSLTRMRIWYKDDGNHGSART